MIASAGAASHACASRSIFSGSRSGADSCTSSARKPLRRRCRARVSVRAPAASQRRRDDARCARCSCCLGDLGGAGAVIQGDVDAGQQQPRGRAATDHAGAEQRGAARKRVVSHRSAGRAGHERRRGRAAHVHGFQNRSRLLDEPGVRRLLAWSQVQVVLQSDAHVAAGQTAIATYGSCIRPIENAGTRRPREGSTRPISVCGSSGRRSGSRCTAGSAPDRRPGPRRRGRAS